MNEMNEKKLAKIVEAELGDVSVSFVDVQKNAAKKRGICVKKAGESVSPTIYYDENSTPEIAAKTVVKAYREHLKNPAVKDDVMSKIQDPGFILEHVFPTLAPACDDFLAGKIYTMYLDLAIIYRVDLGGGATLTVTEDLLERLGISKEDLHTAAMVSVEETAKFYSMTAMLAEMSGMDEEIFGDPGMYVIGNDKKVYGAASILSKRVLSDIAKTLNDDLYILPSSIHECIAVAASGAEAIAMSEMVHEVNVTQVSEEERLSDHAYIYHIKTGELEVA